jgi:hypothetical protein
MPPPPNGPNQTFAVIDGTSSAYLGVIALPMGTAATQPDLSKDDSTLVFVVPAAKTIQMAGDDHFKLGAIWGASVDLTNYALGMPAQLIGATGHNYYYPALSSDKSWLVLNDAPDAPDTMTSNGDAFYNRNARVKIAHYPPASGATPIDLAALNIADGLSNSWPRWSPFPTSYHGHAVLWVSFSSNRDYGLHLVNHGFDNCYPPEGPMFDQPQPLSKMGVTYTNCAQPQIWMAAVVVDPDTSLDAKDRSFPAFWLPFQDVTAHNHSAQWVEQVQGGPPPMSTPDGGTPVDAGGGGSPDGGGGGPAAGGSCAASGQPCGAALAVCCSDTVCCGGTCTAVCVR